MVMSSGLTISTEGVTAQTITSVAGVQEVIIYPVAIHQGTTELADDGTSPVFTFDTESVDDNAEITPGVHWSELINFEQNGISTIDVISLYIEFEWQTKFTVGGGDGTTATSKIQMTNDGGSTWVDVTDNFGTTSVTYVNRIRAGVGRWFTTITSGTNQLGFRLVGFTDDSVGGVGRSTAESQVRINSYIRITYRTS